MRDAAAHVRVGSLAPRDATTATLDLSSVRVRIGDVLRALGDGPGALRAYEQSLAIVERLAQIDPRNTRWQTDLARVRARLVSLRSPDAPPQSEGSTGVAWLVVITAVALATWLLASR